MLFKTRSASVYGIEAHLVDVEVNLTAGGGGNNGDFHIVGLPDVAVRESRSRVIAAIRNSGFSFPYQKIVVNLAPADIKKEGSAFDLPLAVAILGGVGLLNRQDMSDFLLVGELSLDGKLRPVRGVLSIAMLARQKKIPCLIVATANAREAAVVAGIEVHPMRNITEVVDFLNGNKPPRPLRVMPDETSNGQPQRGDDFRDVRGQFHAKRAIEVAMAGGHNVLLIWTLPGDYCRNRSERLKSACQFHRTGHKNCVRFWREFGPTIASAPRDGKSYL